MKQYCYLLEDITPELLLKESGGDYEELRAYLRQRGTQAYQQKVRAPSYCNCPVLSCGGCPCAGPVIWMKRRGLCCCCPYKGVCFLVVYCATMHDAPNVQVDEIEAVEKGLLQEAQRFFLLTQTDNMWKEHLQVSCPCIDHHVLGIPSTCPV